MQKSTFSILFFIKKNEPKQNGLSTIFTRITSNGEQIQFSTKLEIALMRWNQKLNKAIGSNSSAKEMNLRLSQIKASLYKFYFDTPQGYTEDQKLKRVKMAFLGIKPPTSLMYLFERHIKHMKRRIGISISKTTVYKYSATMKNIQEFLVANMEVGDVDIRSVSTRTLDDLYLFLRKERALKNNTAMKHMQKLSTIFNIAIEDGLVFNNPFRYFSIYLEETTPLSLSLDEIKAIESKRFSTQRLSAVRDIFVFSCWTGICFSDICKLNSQNIIKGFDGNSWIVINRTKTKAEARIPLLPPAKKILDRYFTDCNNTSIFKISTNQKTNEYLKEIADICGIDKRLTYHVSRHTFAIQMLNYGVSIESLSKMMGHKTIKSTQVYARVTDRKIKQEIDRIISCIV